MGNADAGQGAPGNMRRYAHIVSGVGGLPETMPVALMTMA